MHRKISCALEAGSSPRNPGSLPILDSSSGDLQPLVHDFFGFLATE
jgi:hypothetical protein